MGYATARLAKIDEQHEPPESEFPSIPSGVDTEENDEDGDDPTMFPGSVDSNPVTAPTGTGFLISVEELT